MDEQLKYILERKRNYEKDLFLSDIKCNLIDLEKFTNLESIRLEECKTNTYVNAPITLKKLIFVKCDFANFEILPENLEILIMSNCNHFENFQQIPIKITNLPEKLKKLKCTNSLIESFDNLPTGLEILQCDGCGARSLDYLPNGLFKLSCKFNSYLSRLDFLPNSLKELYCDANEFNNYNYIENLHEIKQTYPNLKIHTKTDLTDLIDL